LIEKVVETISDRARRPPFFSPVVIRDESIFTSLLNLHLAFERAASILEHESRFISMMGELVEGDLLAGFNGIENLNRDRDEGKCYAAFPDAAHGVLLI
jgi:hypothetical protein